MKNFHHTQLLCKKIGSRKKKENHSLIFITFYQILQISTERRAVRFPPLQDHGLVKLSRKVFCGKIVRDKVHVVAGSSTRVGVELDSLKVFYPWNYESGT